MSNEKIITDTAILRIIESDEYVNFLVEEAKKRSIKGDFIIVNYALKQELTERSKELYENFKLFHKGIKKFANKNFYYSEKDPGYINTYNFYYVKMSDVVFKIGITSGTVFSTFFSIVPEPQDTSNVISIEDVRKNVLNNRGIFIEEKISKIKDDILALINEGVPYEAIFETIVSLE